MCSFAGLCWVGSVRLGILFGVHELSRIGARQEQVFVPGGQKI